MHRNHFFHLHTRSKKIQKQHSKNITNSRQKPLQNQAQSQSKQRSSKIVCRVFQIPKKYQKRVKMGSQKKGNSAPFWYFLIIGIALGTHMAPRASKRGPRQHPKLNFISFRHPFSHIFAFPFWIQSVVTCVPL